MGYRRQRGELGTNAEIDQCATPSSGVVGRWRRGARRWELLPWDVILGLLNRGTAERQSGGYKKCKRNIDMSLVVYRLVHPLVMYMSAGERGSTPRQGALHKSRFVFAHS